MCIFQYIIGCITNEYTYIPEISVTYKNVRDECSSAINLSECKIESQPFENIRKLMRSQNVGFTRIT